MALNVLKAGHTMMVTFCLQEERAGVQLRTGRA
jgi:hypothetical protein